MMNDDLKSVLIVVTVIVVWFGVFLFGAMIGYSIAESHIIPQCLVHEQAAMQWQCMEGCSNMQELVYGNLTYDKNYYPMFMEKLHNDCADVCRENILSGKV